MSAVTRREEQSPAGWREIRHYAYVERPFDDVWGLLARSPALAFGAEPQDAGAGEALLHVRRGGMEVSREVRLHFGGLVCNKDRARLSLRWEDAQHPRLFPVLTAVLEAAPLKAGRYQITQVGVVGRYRPPFGPIGAVADRMAGEAVAVDSVTRFVQELAHRLETLIPEPEVPPETDDGPLPSNGTPTRRAFLPVDRLEDRPGGAAGVGRYLETAPGVTRAEVHPRAKLITVEFDPALCDPLELLEQLEDDREFFRDGLEADLVPAPGSDV